MQRILFLIILFFAVSAGAAAQEPEAASGGRMSLRERIFGSLRAETHVVNRGETAWSIARRYGVTLNDLIDANPGFDPERLSIGQRIRIPRRAIGTATAQEIDTEFERYAEAAKELEEAPGPDIPAEMWVGGSSAADTLFFPDGEYSGDREWQPFEHNRPVQVALILPFTTPEGREEVSMADYYRGTLLALRDLKADGISVDLSVYDTRTSYSRVREILWDLDGADLILGPRDKESFDEAAHFARQRRIPVVSPQSLVEGGNPFVYQARPAPEYQYEKLKPYLTGEYNVVLIDLPEGADRDFLTEIEPDLPFGVRRIAYAKSTLASALGSALSRERENIVIVPTTTENMTDEILAILSSVQNSVLSRTGRGYGLRVMGSPQWARLRNNNRELFFKLQAMYPTLYYVDRTNPAVADFERRYLEAFGTLPSLFSYRGYDVTKIFVTAIHRYGSDYDRSINRVNADLLQVPYRFEQDFSGKWVNDQWVLVRYRNDYIIEVR